VPDELRACLAAFDAGDRPAAVEAATWLREQALDSHATSRTWLLLAQHRIAGFYSLASTRVELRQSHRRRLGLHSKIVHVPATLVTWIAKDHRGDIGGEQLLLHAVGIARRAAAWQATAVLVVEPFDDETATMRRERYGFRAAVGSKAATRLWLPLDAV
jgi:hypothetical protein